MRCGASGAKASWRVERGALLKPSINTEGRIERSYDMMKQNDEEKKPIIPSGWRGCSCEGKVSSVVQDRERVAQEKAVASGQRAPVGHYERVIAVMTSGQERRRR